MIAAYDTIGDDTFARLSEGVRSSERALTRLQAAREDLGTRRPTAARCSAIAAARSV